MIDDEFKEIIKSNKGCAIIMAGSYSDEPCIDEVVKSLESYQIPNTVKILSAHKQVKDLMELVKYINSLNGSIAYVAIAGGTDALSGVLGFHALGPVISCAPDTNNTSGKEKYQSVKFNESCLTNPPGSSNAYIAKPTNVGKFIAQMYSGVNPIFRVLLKEKNEKKIADLEKKGLELEEKYKI